ncbi:twin-arginine translocase subunit TatC [Sedimentibacter sp. MB31-C6]|uniref:twin-arginine translocase subunit TatC n=1 Tax=Sedimentibacter sp. MB31-C6 TaxID=3109366 RepID=UPI002DDD541B|nr:twin-arginine translocase subunit TatC [Sedimentibacter sp. MB36-C1]WSI04457.1 twin-arginine translocase subunit TatC [Sedimentibacter sp. MB36-C1]
MSKRAVKKKDKKPSGEMGIIEHLSELRKRIFVIVIVFLTVAVVGFNFCDDLVALLVDKAKEIGYQMVYIAPGELFSQYIRLAIVGGLVLSSPVILFEVWLFVKPALMKKEKTTMFLSLLAGLICFLLGTLFAYFVVVPVTLTFFISVDQNHSIQPTITIQNFVSFVLTTLITFGAIFEMPVVTILLSELGLLKTEWLIKSRKAVIVVIFIIGAIITPPDIISQILVALPMILLFEISVLISRVIRKRKRDNEDDED